MSGERGELLLCATPIGNLEDVTLRVLRALREADIVACEDTRHTRLLLERHQIHASELVSFHEHNESARAPQLLERMRAGANVALVSDAGTPLISDPGYQLVRAALEESFAVRVLPGPSSVTTALAASGMAAEGFCFTGFLPRKRSALERVLAHPHQTLLAFESPRRLAQTLNVLSEVEPSRQVAVCRELTKLHEEVRRGEAAQLAAHYREHPPRGEIVLVIAPASAEPAERSQALGALAELVDAGARPRPAAAVLAKLTGLSANELYEGLLAKGG